MPTYRDFFGAIVDQSATPTNTVTGSSGSEPLTGSVGADLLVGGGAGHAMSGGSGDDTYQVNVAADSVLEQAGSGVDTVQVRNVGLYSLPAEIENLLLFGKMTAVGNDKANLIVGNINAQTITGGAGNDVMVGGAGADIFIFGANSGYDVITDFSDAQSDQVRLLDYGFTTFAQVLAAMTQSGSDVVLQLSPTSAIKFLGATIADFQASDFQLGVDTGHHQLTFSDEFSAPLDFYDSQSDTGVWSPNFATGDQNGPRAYTSRTLRNNDEKQLYVDPSFVGSGDAPLGLNPFTVSGGVLDIKARATTKAEQPDLWFYKYASGLLTTAYSFSQTYGYFEVSAKMPSGQGVWPAFWLLPTSFSSPPELDVVEQIGGDTAYFTSHSNVNGVVGSTSFVPNISSQFHTYGVLWSTTGLTWYVDGGAVATAPTPADMNKPMYLLLNLAVGGGFPGDPPKTFTSADFQVDYVRAYSLDATGGTDGDLGVRVNGSLIGEQQKHNLGFTLTGLDAGATAKVTFTDSLGGTVEVVLAANGQGNADLTSLANGAITMSLQETLAGGGVVSGLGQSFTIDPGVDGGLKVALPFVLGQAQEAAATFNLSGLDAGYGATITFTDSLGHTAVAAAAANGAFTVDLTSLVDGAITVALQEADGAGHVLTGAPGRFMLDTTGDDLGDLAFQGTRIVNGLNQSKYAFSVAGVDKDTAATITFTDAAGHTAKTVVNSNSSPFISLAGLTDGAVTVTVAGIDDAGNTSAAAPMTLLLDSTADAGLKLSGAPISATVGAANRANAGFTVQGLDADASAVVTFTDLVGHKANAIVAANGAAVVDLTGFVDGKVTAALTAIDRTDNKAVGTGFFLTLDTSAPPAGVSVSLSQPSVNAFQKGYVPVSVVGLTGAGAVLTFTDQAGGSVQAPVAADGRLYVDLTALAAGSVQVSLQVNGSPTVTAVGALDLAPGLMDPLNASAVLLAPGGSGAVTGSAGADLIVAGPGDEAIDGSGGANTVSYDRATLGVTANLATAQAKGYGLDTFVSVQNLIGSAFNDKLTGSDGANILMGGAFNDSLNGGAGDDVLAGGEGDDVLNGSAGIDIASYFDARAGVTVTLMLKTAQDTGGAGLDTLGGMEGIWGSDFNDLLTGNDGANTLSGGLGGDRLTGGRGADALYGGAGADTFVYVALTDSKTTADKRDHIFDFSTAQGDRIDLSLIDANTKVAGDDPFIWAAAFTHVAGQLTSTAQGGGYLVQGDTNGDGKADFAILVDTPAPLSAADFIL